MKRPAETAAPDERPSLAGADWRVADLLADPVLLLDGDGVVRRANATARRRLGVDQLVGQSVLKAVPLLARSPFARRVRQAIAVGDPVRFTTRYANDRVSGHYDVTAVPVEAGVLVQLRERSVRIAAPDEAEAERITEALVEAGLALSTAFSLDRVLQILVDIARHLVGARYAALGVLDGTGAALADFVTAGLTPEQRQRIGSSPTGGGILGLLVREPSPMRLRDLRRHPASAGIPHYHPSMKSFLGVPIVTKGRLFGNLYVTDKLGDDEFTDHDLALLEMLGAQAAVAVENAQARQERDRFFAAASHELGNAVAGITVWARHLLRQADDAGDPVGEGLGKIIQGAESAHKLIEDLLSLSRIQEGRLTLTSWPVDLGEVAADAVSQIRPGAESAGLRLEFTPPPDRHIVDADPMRVRQILLNLLANATKFTPAGGLITVGVARTDNGDVLAWIRDQGAGIAAEDLERIFRPYEQVSGTARGRGTGLGLPLSRQLARLMGGEILVESQLGAGSTFTLRLPPRKLRSPHS